jgi:hypothetical protein
VIRRSRSILVILFGVLTAAGVGVGCLATVPRDVELARFRGPYRVQVYRDGQPTSEVALAADSSDERAVAQWFASHQGGWRPSLVS